MTNKEKLIKLYNESLETGELPRSGLCKSLSLFGLSKRNLLLFVPKTPEDYKLIGNKSTMFWASDLYPGDLNKFTKFTPLRQTILAFLITMED